MSLSKLIKVSFNSLLKYKGRTFLMMLGIIIGIATLTVVVAMTKGAQNKIMQNVQNFGPNSVMISAGGGKAWGPADEHTTTLTLEDVTAIKESVNGIKYIAPFTMHLEQDIVYGNKYATCVIVGVTPEWADAWQWYAEKGDFISDEDVSSLSKNCVLGQTIVKELFGNQDPIGETVRINNTNFKVIGIMKKRGTSPIGMDMDSRITIPLPTAMRRLFNITHIGMLRLYLVDPNRLDEVTKSVASILRERHHITPPEEDDFRVTNSIAIAKTVQGVSQTLVILLGLLSLVALLIGGIVIANIMFISVNERRKEIGIRRAFGARARDIMNQFLVEALIITTSGGIIGTILGIAMSKGIAFVKKMPVAISWEPFAIAIVFSMLVGVLSGLQPAKRAASLDPVEAIRG
jgi:putative ABC transport system permease protein